jgi:hypothetical protein
VKKVSEIKYLKLKNYNLGSIGIGKLVSSLQSTGTICEEFRLAKKK